MIRSVKMLFVCIALLTAAPAQANLLLNGSFDEATTPAVVPGSFATFANGSTGIPSWTVGTSGADSVSVISTSYTESGITFTAQDGPQWLDLTDAGSNSMTNNVSQTVATTPGLHNLSFYVGSATNGSTIMPSTVDLFVNDVAAGSFTNPATPTTTLHWLQFNVPITAVGASTKIAFFNGSAASNHLSALDNVSLTAVPEPTSLFAIIPFAVAGFVKFRARRNRSS